MPTNIKNALLVSFLILSCAGCSQNNAQQQQAEQAHVEQGIVAAGGDDPNSWAPSKEAVEQAAKDAQAQASAPSAAETGDTTQATDPAMTGMERMPPPPMPSDLSGSDEAEKYGLPEEEEMARGELHVKRIRY